MIIHKKAQHPKKYVQGRGLIINRHKKYVHGKGLINSPMETALNIGKTAQQLATVGINAGKTIKDVKNMANAKNAASEIKKNNILDLLEDIKAMKIGKGFQVI